MTAREPVTSIYRRTATAAAAGIRIHRAISEMWGIKKGEKL